MARKMLRRASAVRHIACVKLGPRGSLADVQSALAKHGRVELYNSLSAVLAPVNNSLIAKHNSHTILTSQCNEWHQYVATRQRDNTHEANQGVATRVACVTQNSRGIEWHS